MPTLAQLGVEIDPTTAKAGGGEVKDVLLQIQVAAEKMAAALDRFSDVAEASSRQSATAMQKVEKAVDSTTTSLKESGDAAQAAGQKTAAAATTAATAEGKVAEAVQKRATAHKEAAAAAESAGSITTSSTVEAVSAQNRLTESIEKTALVQRNAGSVAFDAGEAILRSEQMQASMLAEAQRNVQALNTALTQVAENHWTQQTETGLVNIIDNSMVLTSRTKEQVDQEFALMQQVRSREAVTTTANQAYAQQMQQAAAQIMATGEAEKAVAAARATPARQAAAPATGTIDTAAQKALAEQAKQQAAAAKTAREEMAKLQTGFGDKSGIAEFGSALQRNSNLLFTFASLMGPAESTVLRLANGFGMAAMAAEKMGNSTSDQSARVKELMAAQEALVARQASLKAAQDANTAAQQVAAAAQAEFATTAAEVTAVVEAEAAADIAAAAAAETAAVATANYNATLTSGTASVAMREAATDSMAAAQVASVAATRAAAAAEAESVAALRAGTEAYETQVAAEAEATVAAAAMAKAQKDVADAEMKAAAAAEAGGASILGMAATILPFLGVLALLAVTLGTVFAAWHIFSSAISAGNQFITLHARFSQFVGDAKAAHDELVHLEELSARTGLDLPDLEQGEAHLISFGAGLREASEEMQNFAAISVRSGKDAIGALGTLYATARDQGNVTMRQIMQLRTVNVDLLPQLRAQTGLTGVQLQHMLSQGNVSFVDLKKAIDNTAESMKSLEIRDNTPEGILHKISGDYDALMRRMGEPISSSLVPFLQTIDQKVLSMGPDADDTGNFVGNMITAINGAIKNGELGSLIYEVITTGTAKGWSYVDKNWFEPAKAALAEVFGAAKFGPALRATFDNFGSLVSLWFSQAGLKIYGYLMEFLYNFEDAIAKSGIWGTGDANKEIPKNSRTADQIYSQNVGALRDQYNREVQQANDDYSAIQRRAGVETGNLTGAFGAAVKAIDIFIAKTTGALIAKPNPMNAQPTGKDEISPTGILRNALTTPADQQGYWTMLLKNPPESMVRQFAEHNAMVLQREFSSIFSSNPVLASLFSPNASVAAPRGAEVPFVGAALPAAERPPAVVPPAQPATMPVRKAILIKPGGEVVSIGDVGNSQGALPSDPGDVTAPFVAMRKNGLLNSATVVGPGGPVRTQANEYAALQGAVDGNTAALNRNSTQTGAATTATTDNTQSVRARITFYDKFEDQYHDHIAYGGDNARAREGITAAVDPKLFAYGSTLNIPALQGLNGSGNFRAEDTGGAVVSKTASQGTAPVIDIYVDAANPDEGRRKMEELSKKYGEYVQVNYKGTGTDPAAPADPNAGHIGGMDVFNRNLDRGRAVPNDYLPHGNTVSGTEPNAPLGNISMDQDAVNQMTIAINNYGAALERHLITQEEFNKRVDELRSKTIGNLTDPNGGRTMADGSFQSFQKQIDTQGSKVQGNQYDSIITAHRMAMDKIMQDQKHADDLMKTNDEGVVNSFIAGVRKQALAAGTLDQAVSKVGSTIVSDLGSGIGNALDEITSGTKTAAQAFKDMAVSILKDISKMLIEFAILAIVKQIAGVGGGGGGGGLGSLGGLLGGGGGGGAGAGMHSGGIVGSEATFIRNVDMSAFNGASRYHNGGILPGEVPIIAQQGEGVFTPEQMANLAPAGQGNSSSQNNEFHSEIHIHQDGSTTSDTHGTGGNDSRELGRQMDALVKSTLVNETRRGGLLDQWQKARARG